MVAVPYGNAEHRADVEVRELVCLKTHWEEFSAQRQLFSVFWRKKKSVVRGIGPPADKAAAHFSKWLRFLALYTFSICLSQRLTVDHVNVCSSQPGCACGPPCWLLLDSARDVQPALQPGSRQSAEKLLGSEASFVMCFPNGAFKRKVKVPG